MLKQGPRPLTGMATVDNMHILCQQSAFRKSFLLVTMVTGMYFTPCARLRIYENVLPLLTIVRARVMLLGHLLSRTENRGQQAVRQHQVWPISANQSY